MSTTTRVLDANVNGTVYTANVNSALEALDTCHSGATPPTDEVANGKLWLDTSTTPAILKIYNNATWEVVVTATGTSQAKLDGIEALADVTDAANVTAAGAVMDSELTDIAAVKALDQGVATSDSPTFAALSDGTDTVETGYVINGSAKAWVNFNGTGAVAIRDSLNVSSLGDNGGGDYNVNFSNNMSSNNYSVSGSPMRDSANLAIFCVYGSTIYGNTIIPSSVRLNVRDNLNSSVDGLAVFSSIHGGLA